MKRRLIIRIEAEFDISDAAIRYQNEQPGLGQEFLAEIDKALANAAHNPRQYPRMRHKPEVRRILSKRFPYRIFFFCRHGAVVVFRVLHAARHDRDWKASVPAE